MSNADKLFYELGYEKEENKNKIFYYILNGAKEKYGMEFDLIYKEITPLCKSQYNEAIYITMQELKAINMKCLELGWIDKETQQLLKYADNPVLRMC